MISILVEFWIVIFIDSDSDFVNEQLTGNIHKIAIVPPNFAGRPKKGHLIFDACFECGNLGRVDYISDFEYDLFIRPDTCNARFRIWFNFTVENVKAEQVRKKNRISSSISLKLCNGLGSKFQKYYKVSISKLNFKIIGITWKF